MRWTRVPDGVTAKCGACGAFVQSGEPLALLTSKLLKRCPNCAGEPIDWAALEREAPAIPAAPGAVARGFSRATSSSGFHHIRDSRIPFDPKSAAANDRD